jgi:ribosome-associated toxin RatA of RatAB toxin-antitoxin module
MIKIKVDEKLNIPASSFWVLIANPACYPQYMKFVTKVEIGGKLEVGKAWHDWTNILVVPMRVKHVVSKLEKNRELGYDVAFPLGGKMLQRVRMEGNGEETKVSGEMMFDLGNPVFNFIIGPILKWRFEDMLKTAINRIKKETAK